MERENFYNPDLSQVHHDDFGRIAEKAGEAILQIIEQEQRAPARIIDLGCGSGITARILSERGHEVIGVDYSPSMLALARENAPKARFVQASLFDYQPPGCHFISAIGEAVNYLFDDKSNPAMIEDLFQRVYDALQPGGHFIVDALAPGALHDENPQRKIVENEQYAMFIQLHEDRLKNTLTREITLFYRKGELYQKSKEIHRQRLYSPDFIGSTLEKAGFTVRIAQAYADYSLRNGHHAFFAHKSD